MVISNWYKLEKSTVSEYVIESCKLALTIQPRKQPDAEEEVPPMLLYRETGTELWVPITWGIEKFGEVPRVTQKGRKAKYTTFPDPYHPSAPEGQAEFMAELMVACRTHKVFSAEAGTGSGKTVLSLNTIARLGKEGLAIVPTDRLVRQWQEEAKAKLGLNDDQIGTVKQDVCDYEGKHITIASLKSIISHDYPEEFYSYHGVVVYDELHTMAAQQMSNVFGKFHADIQIGVSATMTRRDGRDELLKWWLGEPAVVADDMKPAPIVIVPFEVEHFGQQSIQFPFYLNDRIVGELKNVYGIWCTNTNHGVKLSGNRISETGFRKLLYVFLDQQMGYNYPYSKSMAKLVDRWGTRNSMVTYLGNNYKRNDRLATMIHNLYTKGRVVMGISDSVKQLQYIETKLLGMGVPQDVMCIVADKVYTGEKRIKLPVFEGLDIDVLKHHKAEINKEFGCQFRPSVRSVSITGDRIKDVNYRNRLLTKLSMITGLTRDVIKENWEVVDDKRQTTPEQIDKMLTDKNMRIYLPTYGIMKMGVDVKWLDAGIDLTPRVEGIQVIGRIRRLYEGSPLARWYTPIDVGISRMLEGINAARLRDYAKSANVTIKNIMKGGQ